MHPQPPSSNKPFSGKQPACKMCQSGVGRNLDVIAFTAEQGSEQAGGVVWKDIKQNMIR